MPSLRRSFIGFLKVSRIPNLVVIACIQIITAHYILEKQVIDIIELPFIALVISTLMIAAAGYIINDYHDQKIDMINRPERVIVGISLKRRIALASHSILNLAAIYIGYLIDPLIFLIHIFSAFFLWYYSNALRRLPFVGNLTIASLTGLVILIVGIFYRASEPLLTVYAFFAFLISLIREIIKDIEDVKGEAAFGCSTIPVVWGIRGAKVVILLISIAGSAYLAYYLLSMANQFVRVFFVSLLPLFAWFIWVLLKADTQKQYSKLHTASNWIILLGIISILFI